MELGTGDMELGHEDTQLDSDDMQLRRLSLQLESDKMQLRIQALSCKMGACMQLSRLSLRLGGVNLEL